MVPKGKPRWAYRASFKKKIEDVKKKNRTSFLGLEQYEISHFR